jgi:hypothetical protein
MNNMLILENSLVGLLFNYGQINFKEYIIPFAN